MSVNWIAELSESAFYDGWSCVGGWFEAGWGIVLIEKHCV